jgi:hypothetical protein
MLKLLYLVTLLLASHCFQAQLKSFASVRNLISADCLQALKRFTLLLVRAFN